MIGIDAMRYDKKIDVSTEAERLGFRVVELWLGDETVWAWHRSGDAADWPHFATKGDAYAWMEDQLQRGAVSDRRNANRDATSRMV